jgi:uncharacterized protein (TIGR02594 family)
MPLEPSLHVVVAHALNVRDQPSIRGRVTAVLKLGEEVSVLGRSGDDYWLKIRTSNETVGWCAHKYLQPVHPSKGTNYPWFAIAQAEVGEKEFPGNADNPRIVEYLSSTTLKAPSRNNDETAWCSAFVNWCLERAGYEGTDSAWAKSWLQWGRPATVPAEGCIVVLTRPDGGHVGFYVAETEQGIAVLGGNQNDQVCVSSYPKDRLLGMRLPGRFDS